MNLSCIIIDDEPLARELLKSYVEKTPVLSLKGSFESAAEAVKTVIDGNIDIIFLDINMPMLNGIEFAGIIPKSTRIIFVTAYDQYALQGFKVNALDYLLKPVSYSDFMTSVGKAGMVRTQNDTDAATHSRICHDNRQSRLSSCADESRLHKICGSAERPGNFLSH